MAIIFNPFKKAVETKALGNYHSFPSKKFKQVSDVLADWLMEKRWYEGLVRLPDSFEDLDKRTSAEGKAEISRLSDEALERRAKFLKSIYHNLRTSLKADMETRNMHGDPRAFASKGEIAAMEELAELQARDKDREKERISKVEDLAKQLELD